MESGLNERYRLLLTDHYLAIAKEGDLKNGDKKWVLVCPFCGLLERTEGRKKHLKGPAAEVAASSCLRRAAALAGLGLELWG